MRSSITLAIAATVTSCLAAMTLQVWNFTDIITIENSALRRNGRLLLTTFTNASLYTLGTLVPNSKAQLVEELPGAGRNAGTSEIGFEDDLFAVPANVTMPLGINGIKVSDRYMYFTNTGQYIYGRVPITEVGYKAGNADVASYSNSSNTYDWGDFVIGPAGNIFAAQTPNDAVQTFLDGTYTTLAGGGNSICSTDPLRSQSVKTEKPCR
ncbi:putative SMP-30/Gluconolactonase/LRE-like region domain-containing protein [Seiridium cardinale]